MRTGIVGRFYFHRLLPHIISALVLLRSQLNIHVYRRRGGGAPRSNFFFLGLPRLWATGCIICTINRRVFRHESGKRIAVHRSAFQAHLVHSKPLLFVGALDVLLLLVYMQIDTFLAGFLLFSLTGERNTDELEPDEKVQVTDTRTNKKWGHCKLMSCCCCCGNMKCSLQQRMLIRSGLSIPIPESNTQSYVGPGGKQSVARKIHR